MKRGMRAEEIPLSDIGNEECYMLSRGKWSLMIAVAFAIGCADAPTAPSMPDDMATPSLQTHDDSSCSGGGGEDDGCGGGEDDGCSGGGGGGGGGGGHDDGGGCGGGGGDIDGPHFSPRWTVCTPSATLIPADANDVACHFRVAGLGPYDDLDMRLEADFAVDYACVNPGGQTLPKQQQRTSTVVETTSYADFTGRIDGDLTATPDVADLLCPNQNPSKQKTKWSVNVLRSVVVAYQLSALLDGTTLVVFDEQQHDGGDDHDGGEDHDGGDDHEGGGGPG